MDKKEKCCCTISCLCIHVLPIYGSLIFKQNFLQCIHVSVCSHGATYGVYLDLYNYNYFNIVRRRTPVGFGNEGATQQPGYSANPLRGRCVFSTVTPPCVHGRYSPDRHQQRQQQQRRRLPKNRGEFYTP